MKLSKRPILICCLLLLVGATLIASDLARTHGQTPNLYVRRNLIVNRYNPADPTSPPNATIIDPLLSNPWGTAIRTAGLGGHFWLAN
ncbi:MAG TPA: hypothetical protein VJ302_23065, partial [Blastocatellia bacterium]|nr:hypothetical protein [Blastocatellia bacterium]HKX30588.1 hypothetical protein [Blastocatellia bacterium]